MSGSDLTPELSLNLETLETEMTSLAEESLLSSNWTRSTREKSKVIVLSGKLVEFPVNKVRQTRKKMWKERKKEKKKQEQKVKRRKRETEDKTQEFQFFIAIGTRTLKSTTTESRNWCEFYHQDNERTNHLSDHCSREMTSSFQWVLKTHWILLLWIFVLWLNTGKNRQFLSSKNDSCVCFRRAQNKLRKATE